MSSEERKALDAVEVKRDLLYGIIAGAAVSVILFVLLVLYRSGTMGTLLGIGFGLATMATVATSLYWYYYYDAIKPMRYVDSPVVLPQARRGGCGCN